MTSESYKVALFSTADHPKDMKDMLKGIDIYFVVVEKGPAADAKDAPQP
jgi:hypothetical protein